MSAHRLFALGAATALFVAMSLPCLGQELKNKPLAVTTPDGLTISAQEWGNPNGLGIVFIHGFSQSNLSWMRQTNSDLAREFHIVTYDLRGHGNSDKPLEAARYRDGKAWADEVQAVIDAAGLKRPVLVGWSYAGRVISDYVTNRGANGISGIDFVDASIKFIPEFVGDNLKNLPLMASEDMLTNIAATRTFLHGCFSKQPSVFDGLAEFARTADLFVTEVIDPDEVLEFLQSVSGSTWSKEIYNARKFHMEEEHMTPESIAKLASAAKVKKIVLTHFPPRTKGQDQTSQDFAMRVKAGFFGDVVAAKDLERF
jgi:pimeloyl-ACP methyl ester carboxylesterase